jgi:hypothetical protein
VEEVERRLFHSWVFLDDVRTFGPRRVIRKCEFYPMNTLRVVLQWKIRDSISSSEFSLLKLLVCSKRLDPLKLEWRRNGSVTPKKYYFPEN